MSRFLSHSILTLAGLLALGCGSGTDTPTTVRGKIDYKGAPLRSGTIVFAPDEDRGTTGSLAKADVQPDGTYSLRANDISGVSAGWYRVTVVAVASPPPTNQAAGGPRFVVPRSLLPDKYRDPQLSNLSCEVKPGTENVVNFNLD